MGVECLRCGVVTVYCDFAAARCFSERGWSVAAGDAIKRFLCPCGSRDLRFRPVAMAMRPKPIPARPAPLRPIYREDERSLRRRGPADFPDKAAIDTALSVLERAIYACRYTEERVPDPHVTAALEVLRPYCFDTSDVDGFRHQLALAGKLCGGHAETALTGIRRQLGVKADGRSTA
ncbi:hypothetical protein [Sphingomonas jatrophae]|uniref:hypothetical protein n=1 Tax=Sphingomonas jatrophae TaxID=1166337 RepID=UPI00104220CD|nr:hypothetical protein [Sphingomonas jatrophae]